MKLQVEFEGNTYDVEVEFTDKDTGLRFATKPRRKVRLHADDKTCRSPMCGTVVRVDVKPGQKVEADEVVLVLEAMKMETNITAGRACVVKSVNVAAGSGVKTDEVMVEFE